MCTNQEESSISVATKRFALANYAPQGRETIINCNMLDLPGKILLAKINFGKILPGKKNSVPELKNGGKNSVPSGIGMVKRKFSAKHRIFFAFIFSQ